MMYFILILAASFSSLFQRGFPGLPFRAGPGDLLIFLLCGICGIQLLKKKEKLSLPPVSILVFAGAVLISGGGAVLFGNPGFSLIKEEIQFTGILVFGWIGAEFLLKKDRKFPVLFIRTVSILLCLESLVVFIHLLFGGNRFSPGFLTLNRNTYSMVLMFALPLLCRTAVDIQGKTLRSAALILLAAAGSTVLSLGACIAGFSGILFTLLCSCDRKKILIPAACFFAGFLLAAVSPERRALLASSVSPYIEENYLTVNRDDEYQKQKKMYTDGFPEWFSGRKAMRYRRWKFTAEAVSSGTCHILVGYGPGSYSDTLRSAANAAGRPAIDTDVIPMYNIGVNEPDTYSGFAVILLETGLMGIAAFFLYLGVPVYQAFRIRGGTLSAAAGGALFSLILMNVFHSHMNSGMFFFVTVVMCILHLEYTAADNEERSSGNE